MTVKEFLSHLENPGTIAFTDTMAIIDEHYDYQPTEFSNGLGDDVLINAAGSNEGSCKIFAFAKQHQLDPTKTLHLFGDYYRIEVLEDPNGTGHKNIRNFIKYGWDGIRFTGDALTPK